MKYSRRSMGNLTFEIEISVDGGVNFETAPKLLGAGATRLISGSVLFGTADIKEVLRGLQNIA